MHMHICIWGVGCSVCCKLNLSLVSLVGSPLATGHKSCQPLPFSPVGQRLDERVFGGGQATNGLRHLPQQDVPHPPPQGRRATLLGQLVGSRRMERAGRAGLRTLCSAINIIIGGDYVIMFFRTRVLLARGPQGATTPTTRCSKADARLRSRAAGPSSADTSSTSTSRYTCTRRVNVLKCSGKHDSVCTRSDDPRGYPLRQTHSTESKLPKSA